MNVNKLTVVGAGTMGQGIAYTAAASGFEVMLFDNQAEQLDKAKGFMEGRLKRDEERGRLKESKERVLSRVSLFSNLAKAASDADFVIEAVPEILSVKLDVFKTLDEVCRSTTVLATNTSTMSPTEIGAGTNRPDRTIAMHFFNPVHRMKLVEIVRGLDTSNETYNLARTVAQEMGKETVEVNEFPGFITSRINCLVGNEAMVMLQEGVASAKDIDKALRLGLNYPMGPLELVDLVGLDVRLRNMQYLHEKLGEKFKPAPLLEKYVKSGRLGRKSGEGFYKYDE
ncbi:3-hydroxyacyl-CoA dehydrogenase NAD-binding domain-containing protein [Alicyclobacillus sp. SO9]|uniref:3-hydroxyacyl-CoA dehydrogenase NAD-binding domain-containing protein n=1 Tax=Alicyclobacillus sp. SO9 TaxID=2665646 RepID=UPI0018E7B854|nr:3-hydroxyacyl-CoA dehydrogenase NAD-binding domain-containing protein [Alicyclobacillus sp. SO9]QQE79257.1 3-hydroxyacyl-CoA dehydrogenase [Alicyclobacillus sp. SO9]